jgi:hypothetical protein
MSSDDEEGEVCYICRNEIEDELDAERCACDRTIRHRSCNVWPFEECQDCGKRDSCPWCRDNAYIDEYWYDGRMLCDECQRRGDRFLRMHEIPPKSEPIELFPLAFRGSK